MDNIHEREQSNVKFKKIEKKIHHIGTIKWQSSKKRQSKSSKGSDLSTDSASDHVQNEEEKKRKEENGAGRRTNRKRTKKKNKKREAD